MLNSATGNLPPPNSRASFSTSAPRTALPLSIATVPRGALRPLIDWLDYNGFTVVKKPAREQFDAQGKRRIKGNMDVDMAVDILELAPRLDHVVLFSGDGDFRRLVEAVQRKGARVTVVSTLRASQPVLADELRRQADQFVDLADAASELTRR